MTTPAKPRILMVDDEANILSGYRRLLSARYEVTTAEGGKAGLEAMRAKPGFQVIVSDMRMPEMDGVQFCVAAHQTDPAAVVMMLTGNADQDTAVRAVNEGAVFRFLNKPCPPETLEKALQDALKQHEVMAAERAVLRDTLSGCVKMLVEAATLQDPRAAQTIESIRTSVMMLAKGLHMEDWRFGLAGNLCLVGRLVSGASTDFFAMSERELQECADRGAAIIKMVPRLAPVAEVVRRQREGGTLPVGQDWSTADRILCASRVVRYAVDFERALHARGGDRQRAVEDLAGGPVKYDQTLLDVAKAIMLLPPQAAGGGAAPVVKDLALAQLKEGMVVQADLAGKDGKLVFAKDQTLTALAIDRARGLEEIGLVAGMVKVLCPSEGPVKVAA